MPSEPYATDWLPFSASNICVHVSGDAEYVVVNVERSDVDPVSGARISPYPSISGRPRTDIHPTIYSEVGVGWWRANVIQVDGGSCDVSFSSSALPGSMVGPPGEDGLPGPAGPPGPAGSSGGERGMVMGIDLPNMAKGSTFSGRTDHPGAVRGMYVTCSFSEDLQGILLYAYVAAPNFIDYVFFSAVSDVDPINGNITYEFRSSQ